MSGQGQSLAGQPWLKYQQAPPGTDAMDPTAKTSEDATPVADTKLHGPWDKYGASPQRATAEKDFTNQQTFMQAMPKNTPEETALGEEMAFERGLPGGTYLDEVRSAEAGLHDFVRGKGFTEGYNRSEDRQNRVMREYDAEHPTASTFRTLGGAALTMAVPGLGEDNAISKLPLYGRSAVGMLTNGIAGATQGFGEGETLDDRRKNALYGGAFGTVTGAVFPMIGAAGRSLTSKAYSISGRPTGSIGMNADDFAEAYAHRALSRDKVSLDDARAKLKKPGSSISDLGDESMVEAGEQAALTGEGRRLGAKLYFDDRMKGREATMAQAVDHMVSDQSMYETMDKLTEGRALSARPLYEKAFRAAKSNAPFVKSLEEQFNGASRKAQETFSAVDDAERELTFAKAKVHSAGDNVYGANSALEAEREATHKLEQAQQNHQRAVQEKGSIHAQLRQAQDDTASGARGGIWSPYLDEVLADPISRTGLREGLELQRLEALGERRSFDPKEYAIKGTDAEGNPIIGGVPNLRTYDAIKQGLDQILEQHRSDTTGQIIQTKYTRAVEKVRKELVKELDLHAPPEYAAARKAWEGPSRLLDAMWKGKQFSSQPHEVIQKYVEGLTPTERDAYKIGVARSLSDSITVSGRGAILTAKRITESTAMKKRLQAALKDDDAFDRLVDIAEGEVKYQQRGAAILGGSATARRTAGGKEFEEIAPVLDDLISGARSGLVGIAASAKTQLGRATSRWIGQKLTGLSQARRDQLAKLLFSTDRDQNLKAIELIYAQGKPVTPFRYRPSLPLGTTTAVTGVTDPRRTEEHQFQPQQ